MVAAFLGCRDSTPMIVELHNGCRFKVRSPMDIWIIKEICLDRQYELASVDIQDGWTIFIKGIWWLSRLTWARPIMWVT
jgi:hypothetical protein